MKNKLVLLGLAALLGGCMNNGQRSMVNQVTPSPQCHSPA